ncbi:MAG: hypothetical protein M0R02_01910 [Bacteroidales bacterium]|jgi:hypothetical protein|nr:hypothetical protein [Bacteroidales bacterium]NLK80750.1 hypothetical protein [Bacteroidales bacterium]HPY82808.1 hypothetical protein [Bacteroidales bacterium]
MKKNQLSNNFFGITELQTNPLPNAIKQQLAFVLFLHPNVSAEEAMIISKNYVTKSSTEAYIDRMRESLDSIDYRKVRKALYEKLESWIVYHNFPTQEELRCIQHTYNKPTWTAEDMEDELYFTVINAFEYGAQRWIKYLHAYAHKMNIQTIDYYLDRYNSDNIKKYGLIL